MDARLEQLLNLLLESERAGVVVLDELSRQVEQAALRRFLLMARDEESSNVRELERAIQQAGGSPSDRTGPFVEKFAGLDSMRDRINLLSRGQAWVAHKVEDALMLAPEGGALREFLQRMANHHRHEMEWERAEVIRLLQREAERS